MDFKILEPDVTFTDYGLVLLAVILAILLYRIKAENKRLKLFTILFYASLALASLFGGTVHGFFPETSSIGNIVLWKLTLLSIGSVALFSWAIAGNIILPKYKKIIFCLASIEFILYMFYVIFINSEFKIAIYNYIPSTIFLLTSLVVIYSRRRDKSLISGIIGIILTFIAAWIQQRQLSLHSIYFNHNAFYHIVQAIALILIFLTFKSIILNKMAGKIDRTSLWI